MKKKISSEMKQAALAIIEDSTIHGIPRVIKSKSLISKIIWTSFFVVCAAGCIYMILTTIFSYLEYKDVTSVEIITDIPATFPMITLCNLNKIQKKNEIISEIVKMYSNKQTFNMLKDFFIMSKLNDLNDTIKQSISFSLEESMIQCLFNGFPCNLKSDFKWYFHPFLGNCYSYNTGLDNLGNQVEIKKISKS